MATSYTREWIGFFTGCGIPEDVATMYALIFYDNRIQKNMLLDLNKEYLKDMGITVMGDVIAILRHAKIIHEKYIREQILAVDDNLLGSKSKLTSDSNFIDKNSTPMKRILKHYTRKYNSPDLDPISEIEPLVVSNVLLEKGNKKIGLEKPLKRKISATIPEKKPDALEISPPKIRRVLAEHEGKYKIKMPAGTTERSKKLLEQAKKRKAKTVFERLGESSVSSTTSEISSTSTTFVPLNKDKNPSVFARLGEKTSLVSSTSCADNSDTSPPQDQLPYAGILKSGVQTKTLGKTTMRADEQNTGSKNKKGISVKRRLGLNQPSEGESRNRTLIKTVRTGQEGKSLQMVGKEKARITLGKHRTEIATTKLLVSTSQTQASAVRNLKRRMAESSDVTPSKKVRFGNISHRLIPGNPERPDTNFVKNYSKITMTINNANANSNNIRSLRIKQDSLNIDKVKDRIGVKARVGNMPVKGRLGNRIGGQGGQMKKIATVKDRLG